MYRNPDRHYRTHDNVRSDEYKFQVIVEESDLWITVPQTLEPNTARDAVLRNVLALRHDIKLWSEIHPAFQHSLVPVETPKHAPDIVRRMAHGAKIMGVGPFAAVAGTIAQMVAANLVALLQAQGLPSEVMVENGGDTFIYSRQERVVALLPDPEVEENLGLVFRPGDFPLSLCSSSGTVGHSLSFGRGDIAMVRAKDGALADAAATAYGNMLQNADDVGRVLRQAEKDARLGVDGVFAQCEGQIGLWGKLELTALKPRMK